LPAGTISIGGVGIADGGMIGVAVALEEPGENNCEVCAPTTELCSPEQAQSNITNAAARQTPADVTRLFMTDRILSLTPMRRLFSPNRGDFKPRVCGRIFVMVVASTL
jgi:hypothetical protein